jgi:uncharacterized protein (DUF608 family)
MKPIRVIILMLGLLASGSVTLAAQALTRSGGYNSWYAGPHLDHVTFPIGGIGAGMVGLDGNGAWSHLSIGNQPDVYNEPFAFAAIMVKGFANGAKLLQGPVPNWRIFGPPGTGNGGGNRYYGLPRFDNCRFMARFPFGIIELTDDDIPLDVRITGWSPFIPGDSDQSSLPAGSMEYTFTNTSNKALETVFSWNSKNIIARDGLQEIQPFQNGFCLYQPGNDQNPEYQGWFAVFADQEAVVDHCWFRGGWFDALTIAWKDISEGRMEADSPKGVNPPGASLFVPLTLQPGESKTIKLLFCWYMPETRISVGSQPSPAGAAFGEKPAPGAASGQQEVNGFAGKQLLNTYYPSGDGLTGRLQSPEFKISKPFIAFLVGGGSHAGTTCINLMVDGKVVYSTTGKNEETLRPQVWDVRSFKGKKAVIEIVDEETGSWGHINVDQILFTDQADANPLKPAPKDILFEDFEGSSYGAWIRQGPEPASGQCDPAECEKPKYYKPWYAGRFKNINEVAAYWRRNYEKLRSQTELFTNTFYSSTLPAEVLEAVAANLTILKSPTVLRDESGKLWAWEGCSDQSGCCYGSCTHVWNYAQAIPHLFPDLERSLRETEFLISQDEEGHQTFRSNLPLTEPKHSFHAASDGQLGGIMKAYREWRIYGETYWLSNIYPFLKASLDYCIRTWDPDHTGALVEPHHNTYDIEFWGPDGMCSSFYLGALTAFTEMSKFLEKPCDEYVAILSRGKLFMEKELFDGEYFIQKIQWKGLRAQDPTTRPGALISQDEEYQLLLREGPKYQYGTGCLSDGILGMWMASVCGLPEAIEEEMVRSHLVAVHQYNFKSDLRDHDNPQRPTFAVGNEGGLLLCSWPKGGKLTLPFVYSNEVWTGIEYQVASHLLFKGEVERGLEIVRACRDRYDGIIRNPFNEYECGHWYARALASYGLIQGLTGIRYDAVDRVLHIQSRIGGDFQSFISTATGYGLAGLRDGEPFLEVKSGTIDVDRIEVR